MEEGGRGRRHSTLNRLSPSFIGGGGVWKPLHLGVHIQGNQFIWMCMFRAAGNHERESRVLAISLGDATLEKHSLVVTLIRGP